MKSDLQGIFDALLEGVVILDEDGRVELTNSPTLSDRGSGTPLRAARDS